MKMRESVLAFINSFSCNQEYSQVIEIFTRGRCYWFAKILEERFHGTLMYDEVANHFGCYIGPRIYDITGDVTNQYNWKIWWNSDAYHDKLARERIYQDCIW